MSDSDAKKSLLRTMVSDVERVMTDTSPAPVREAWQRLVAALDLGPEPAVRPCPKCGRIGMAQATRCGFCWVATPPTA